MATLSEPLKTYRIAAEELAAALNISQHALNRSLSFAGHGGDSLAAVRFSAGCKFRGVAIAVDHVLFSASIANILQSCSLVEPIPLANDLIGLQPSGIQIGSFSSDTSINSKSNCSSFSSPTPPPPTSLDRDIIRLSNTNTAEDSAISKSLPGTPEAPYPTEGEKLKEELQLFHTESEDLNPCEEGSPIITNLSESQVSLIHGGLQVPGTNVVHYYETYLPEQIPALKAAWKRVVKSEPVFNALYCNPEDGCVIAPRLHWREYSTCSLEIYQAALESNGAGVQPWTGTVEGVIDLGIRFTVVHLDQGAKSRSTIVWSVHHAMIDGWSGSQVLRRVRAEAGGCTTTSGTPYTEVVKSLERLRKEQKHKGDEFWTEQKDRLDASRDELMLPVPILAGQGESLKPTIQDTIIILGTSQFGALKTLAKACGVTPMTVLHAAWAIMLGIYADTANVRFGIAVSGRNVPLPGIVDTTGPLVNTLPLQVDIDETMSLIQFLQNVYQRMLRLGKFSWTTSPNGFSRTIGTMMAMQTSPDVAGVLEGNEFVPIEPTFTRQTTNIPLSAVVREGGEILLQYNSERYETEYIETFANTFRDLLVAMRHPDVPLHFYTTSILDTKTRAKLRALGNCESGATTKSSVTEDLVTLFEKVAVSNPEAIAIEHAGRRITYGELLASSGRLAGVLASLIEPEETVSVHADASINWLISIFGILRAGGVYCPIDAAHAQPYRDSLVEASRARYFLATTSEVLAASPESIIKSIDVAAVVNSESSHNSSFPLRSRPRPWELAYLCFTSGSTGKPKGVQCTHQSLVAFQRDPEVRLFAKPGRRISQVMSVAFDGSIHELFSSLCYGATLVLREAGDLFGVLKKVDSAILTPTVASLLEPKDYPNLKALYLVGEAVPQAVCDSWSSQKALYNMYGPTEGTGGATIVRLQPNKAVTIGRPNPSTRIYLLSHRRRLMPVGSAGEIYLAGVQIAKGYLGQPLLTPECFLPDSICGGLGEYMYKTGDRGYWDSSGNLVYLGRIDRQIKLRGFRVDLEDLEARVLRACQGARAVGIVRQENELVCMIQTESKDTNQLRAAMSKVVPAFAMPKYVVTASKLPVTSTGKIDYKAIAASADYGSKDEDRLETETEATTAKIWTKILNVAAGGSVVGSQSNFAAMGGHSLEQLRLASRLSAAFGVRITLRMINSFPTLRTLCSAIDQMLPEADQNTNWQRRSTQTACMPSPIEQEWWQKYALNMCTSAFNVSYVGHLVDSSAEHRRRLVDAWNLTLARHSIFRSRYIYHRCRGLRRILSSHAPRVEKLSSVDVQLELNRPFDLAGAPPVRVVVTKDVLVATWSHIVCDYTTLNLILADVRAAYHEAARPLAIQPPCQRAGEDLPAPPCYLNFWSSQLAGVELKRPTYLGIATDRLSYRGTSHMSQVAKPLWRGMREIARANEGTLQQMALAATALALSSGDGSDMDITLGLPYLNRQTEAEMNTVGLFLEPLPVRIAFPTETTSMPTAHHSLPRSVQAYVSAVQASAQQSLSHAVPWNQLLSHLVIDPQDHIPNHPLFDCMVSFHDHRATAHAFSDGESKLKNQSDKTSDLQYDATMGIRPLCVWSEGAKFRLMVEFTALSDETLLLRLEYDRECYDQNVNRIKAVQRMILRAVEGMMGDIRLSKDGSYEPPSFESLRTNLRDIWEQEIDSGFTDQMAEVDDLRLLDKTKAESRDFFGHPLSSL